METTGKVVVAVVITIAVIAAIVAVAALDAKAAGDLAAFIIGIGIGLVVAILA
jgi:hypothetical protein